jgi:hypothetical protein
MRELEFPRKGGATASPWTTILSLATIVLLDHEAMIYPYTWGGRSDLKAKRTGEKEEKS